MKILKKEELQEVKGGLVGTKLLMGLITGGAFFIGLLDGILRPLKCRH